MNDKEKEALKEEIRSEIYEELRLERLEKEKFKSMASNIQTLPTAKKGISTTSKFFIILFTIIAIWGGGAFIYTLIHNNDNGGSSSLPIFESKELRDSDFSLTFQRQAISSVFYTVKPTRDIETITIRVSFLNSSGVVLNTNTKTFTNLNRGESYSFEFGYNLIDSFGYSSFKAQMVSGRRK